MSSREDLFSLLAASSNHPGPSASSRHTVSLPGPWDTAPTGPSLFGERRFPITSAPTPTLDPNWNPVSQEIHHIQTLATHVLDQQLAHLTIQRATHLQFEDILNHLQWVKSELHLFLDQHPRTPPESVSLEVDPDRSVAILRFLWHTISFTTRGNHKPLALPPRDSGEEPLFCGRIIALIGDYQELTSKLSPLRLNPYPELLEYEVSSLYIPGDLEADPIMTVNHLDNEEVPLPREASSRLFVTKTLDMVCNGGFFHEKWPPPLSPSPLP